MGCIMHGAAKEKQSPVELRSARGAVRPEYLVESIAVVAPARRTGIGWCVLPWKMTRLGAFLLISVLGPPVLAHPLPLKDQPVPGWPRLHIETHYVARIALRGYCLAVPVGLPIPDASLDSCARPDFWRGVCDIFIDIQSERRAALREHEEKHCRGYDNQEDDRLAEALRAWHEHGENRYADMLDFESMIFVSEGSPEGRTEYEEKTRYPR